ncbi:hypothetical protein SUGI_0761220 [Cryptomeria japonica]|nr:hypothetical protein SUGI_0761220 [Cryptomeria japonica]
MYSMSPEISGWELALAMKRPLKTELYELHTIYEEEEEDEEEKFEDMTFLSDDSLCTRYTSKNGRFSYVVILMGLLISLLFLLGRPLLKANTVLLN